MSVWVCAYVGVCLCGWVPVWVGASLGGCLSGCVPVWVYVGVSVIVCGCVCVCVCVQMGFFHSRSRNNACTPLCSAGEGRATFPRLSDSGGGVNVI